MILTCNVADTLIAGFSPMGPDGDGYTSALHARHRYVRGRGIDPWRRHDWAKEMGFPPTTT